MPTYEYICSKCGDHFEAFQSISDKPLMRCPREKCRQTPWGKGKVKRLIGAGAGLLFKGSGFYVTDYRSEAYKKAASKESGAGKPAAGKGKPAADAKSPAGKASPAAGVGGAPAKTGPATKT
ncbi:MAG: zinc ribbon domain-containing protein [Verrucomicrobia bacterium]|nr:zinc ribbon domain-containing protein [Verrucomicrobiota bacterium]